MSTEIGPVVPFIGIAGTKDDASNCSGIGLENAEGVISLSTWPFGRLELELPLPVVAPFVLGPDGFRLLGQKTFTVDPGRFGPDDS